MTQASAAIVDVRSIPPRERHPRIFSTFAHLPDGAFMELVNDHDPKPLYFQFQSQAPGRFGWDYLEEGPEVWRVRISKISGGASCCGSCG